MLNKIILYDTALCNLNCSYCFISKNQGLKEVDEELKKSFADKDYYLNLAKKYLNNDLSNITHLEIWGGETLLHLDRTFNFIDQLINNSPNFFNIMFSSNYAHNNVQNAFQGLMNLLGKYPDRQFCVNTQISLDGPENFTDSSRGVGVTKKILNNLQTLVKNNYYTPKNVILKAHIKATIDKSQLDLFLNKDYIIEYYKFFEKEIIDLFKSNKNNNVFLKAYPIPNFAVPSSYTQNDGQKFAQILKLQKEIESENFYRDQDNKIFKYYKEITWFGRPRPVLQTDNDYIFSGAFCETGRKMIGLLPNNMACSCHRAFADYCENYKNNFQKGMQNSSIITDNVGNRSVIDKITCSNSPEQFYTHVRRMHQFVEEAHDTSLLTTNVNLIRMLADSGQIEQKYKDPKLAAEAFKKIIRVVPICAYENITLCGTPILLSSYIFKLFLNGAIDYIYWQEAEWK